MRNAMQYILKLSVIWLISDDTKLLSSQFVSLTCIISEWKLIRLYKIIKIFFYIQNVELRLTIVSFLL